MFEYKVAECNIKKNEEIVFAVDDDTFCSVSYMNSQRIIKGAFWRIHPAGTILSNKDYEKGEKYLPHEFEYNKNCFTPIELQNKPNNNYRAITLKTILPHFESNKKFFMIGMDTGFGRIESFGKERCINGGIMEQGIVGIASGMAAKGLIPIILSVPNFMALRALEQIRNDVVLQNRNVKIIGSGANNYFSFLGESHCCGNLDVDIFNLIGLDVFNGLDCQTDKEFETLIKNFMESERAGYLRV